MVEEAERRIGLGEREVVEGSQPQGKEFCGLGEEGSRVGR